LKRLLLPLILLLGAVWTVSAAEATLRYIDPITDLTGACYPQAIKLDAEPPAGTPALGSATAPLYGSLRLAGGAYPVAVDRADEGARLYVDTNQDGKMTPVDWGISPYDGRYLGLLSLDLYYEEDVPRSYRLVVIWDPDYPTVLAYCRGAYYQGEVELDGRSYLVAVVDEDTDGRYDDLDQGSLVIDADGDGKLLVTGDSHEVFSLASPFNLDGVTYEVAWLSADGGAIRIEVSEQSVPPVYPLEVGYPAPPFDASDLAGEPISLAVLEGSIVVLDFWAAWCGPCLAELPTLRAIHSDLAEAGVVVVGINLDRSRTAFEDAVASHQLDYRHVYDGDEAISAAYRVAGIPMVYLIGRDGTIVARGLRGLALREAILDLLEEEM